ncbi:MAG: thymidylate kinase [marine bacterium B5-7]|nr:MAG: thymidylate kinase [marine bacterium B5-7]
MTAGEQRGRLITVEGTDGAGKSTQIHFVKEYLSARGVSVITTREPGGTPIGEAIRDILLSGQGTKACARTEILLMFAARLQHLEELIKPALARGEYVVCDRFTDATYAYQGGAGGVENDEIEIVENWVQGSLRPDLTLLFDLPVEVGVKRVMTRGSAGDRFESMALERKRRVRNAYLERAERFSARIRIIDACQSIEVVKASVEQVLYESCLSWDIE